MNFRPTKPTVIIMIAAMTFGVAVTQVPESFAQNTIATGQNATAAEPQTNQTIFVNEGNATTLSLNSTLIPLQATTIEIVTVTRSIDSQMISQIRNMTVTAGATGAPSLDLSEIRNQTLFSPLGESTSTIVTRTDVPFNVTTLQLAANAGQNQTLMLDLDSPEQIVQQLFSTPQETTANQTAQNSTTAP